jgi:methylmalonyl-CoA mutase N-terminal domain/subunit
MEFLREVKKGRDNRKVAQGLKDLKGAAEKEETNLMPHFIDCVKAYATVQEICDVLREVFGEYRPATL